MGETEGRSKIRDKSTLYKERAKRRLSDEATGGEMSTTYVVWKKGQLTMELGVVTTRQNFGFPVPPSCRRCLFVQWQWGTEVDTRAGELSEAKTQRRPHSAGERVS